MKKFKQEDELRENDKEQEVTPDATEETVAQEEPAEASETPSKEEALEKQVAELGDSLKRQMAEFDNFRKRTEKEKAARFDMGVRSVIEKILPVVDNFERGLSVIDEENKDAFAEGMEKTYKQLIDTLTELGVTPIEAIGQKFNPDMHNAVMHVEDENEPDNTVVEEFQKGYMYNGTVVRYSMVKVAN